MSTQPNPSRPTPPCERDLEIYRLVRIQLHRQSTAAFKFGLTPGRISQIVKHVSKYMATLFPGEDLKLRFAEAKRMRLLDLECHERRAELYRQNQLVFEQSQQSLVETQCTYEGSDQPQNLVKTVVKRKPPPLAMGPLREMRRLNNELQWGGERPPPSGRKERQSDGGKEGRREGSGTLRVPGVQGSGEKLPPPECLSEADRAEWPKLMREEQELAVKRLKIWPKISLHQARVPAGAEWAYYPWRTEAEFNVAKLAGMVVKGLYTIEDYFRHLEILELSKPFAHPNLLTKDREGKWQLLYPRQVPLPVMPPQRAALPEASPERVYWPNKSKAEHYAMMRAEMVLRGHLSRDQYETLNAWASWYMNEKYPDPLARLAEKFNEPLAGTKPGPGELPGDEAAPDTVHGACGEAEPLATPPGPGLVPAKNGCEDEPSSSAEPPGPGLVPAKNGARDALQKRIDRLLAKGRRISPGERRLLARLEARQRESREAAAVENG